MENKKGSLLTVFLVIAILLIVVMGALLYMQKTEADRQIAELENNASKLQETTKDSVNNSDSIIETNTAKVKFNESEYWYPTSYYGDNPDDIDSWDFASFIFKENGEFEYVNYQSVFKGTYKVINDKIECDFKEFECEHGSNEKGEFDKDITLTIISDDKIIGSTLEKRENEEGELYWGIQKVVYELATDFNESGDIDNSQSNNTVDNKDENIKVEIPEASTDISEKEGKIIDYFKGIWTTDNGEKILAIDYWKRFCDINKSNNSKEYGTYTVKDETASSVPTITLTYTSGKTFELELTQGSASYLMSNDRKVQYVEYEGYYFGAGEGDEGIFDDDKSIPRASTNISDKEENTISNYFKGVWTTSNGEKILAVDYGKRFCDINASNNSKEYGTYSVEDGIEPTITLTYTSGKTLTLKLTQGGTSYLMSNDGKVQYVNNEAYYFGASEGDEGIFNK